MQREHVEHLIRAAGAISGSKHSIVIGSQSMLGQFYFAGREKGREFCRAVAEARLVSGATVIERLQATEVDEEARARMARATDTDFLS